MTGKPEDRRTIGERSSYREKTSAEVFCA